MVDLSRHASDLAVAAGFDGSSTGIFAKVLTTNDDSGRHGVLVPSDAYSFFPELPISDPTRNESTTFQIYDAEAGCHRTIAYKYYERYPERRLTRLNTVANDRSAEKRLVLVLKFASPTTGTHFAIDYCNSHEETRFRSLVEALFGDSTDILEGRFVLRKADAGGFRPDAPLESLLQEFDRIKALDWTPSLREGDTGIGYTFETLLGLKENNDPIADYQGIELKCKSLRADKNSQNSKINLFQCGPIWHSAKPMKLRIRELGAQQPTGLWACHSQLTTTENNLRLSLGITRAESKIALQKAANDLGHWTFEQLEGRLLQKHSRAAFIKADTKSTKSGVLFKYKELVYCEAPDILKFVELIEDHRIVFEFLMSEKADGRIRNHGYPWRMTRDQFLDYLFSFRIQLR